MARKAFRGSMVALVTPFRDGAVDWPALEKLVAMHLEAGTDGLVPCGTTGESPTLSHDEHDRVIEEVVRLAGGKTPVLAGTGSNSTAEAVRLTKHAKHAGADGALLVAPYYNKPTQEGLYRHFAALAEAAEFPQVLYNIPGRCGIEIAVNTIVRLRKDYPHVVAVKHATGSMDGASELSVACDIDIISGDDSMTFPLMALGGVGVISVLTNIIPKDIKVMTDAALAGDWEAALRLHRKTFPLAKGMLSIETNPIPIKTAMAMRGMIAEEFRLPLCTMASENRTKLQQQLRQYGLL
jgi:4-hydroxy-tetrahydrodipicolinate synthase